MTLPVGGGNPTARVATYLERAELRSERVPFAGCLIWLGGTDSKGYAQVNWRGKTEYLQRILAEERQGQDIRGLIVRHTCDVSFCINPDHLILGTRKDNLYDSYKRKGHNIKIPSEAVEALHAGTLSKVEARGLYKVKMKHLTAILALQKRTIKWSV